MAVLTKANFLTKWAALFADNATRDISEEDMREFRQDISDSTLFLRDQYYNTINSTTGVDDYIISLPLGSGLPGYDNMVIFVKWGDTSTGPVTVNVSGLGVKKVYIDETTQASIGDAVEGRINLLAYDGDLDAAAGGFQMIGGSGVGGSSSTIPLDWDFVAEGGLYPVDLTKMYYSTDATESVYPVGTLFWNNGAWVTK